MIIAPVTLLILVILLMYFLKISKLTKKILIMYASIMCIWIFLSMLNPVGLNPVSNFTYFLLLLNIFCVIFGILLMEVVVEKKIKRKKSMDLIDKVVKSKIIKIVLVVFTLILSYYLIKYLNIIKDLPTSQIRIASFTLLHSSALGTLFYTYIVSGTMSLFSILFAILLVNKKIKNFSFILITIDIIISAFIGFGRMGVFSTLILTSIVFFITKDVKQFLNWKFLAKIFILFIIIVVLFTTMIFVRMNDNTKSFSENIVQALENQFNQVFEYFLGSIRTLDIFVKDGFEEFPNHTYLRATFAGVDEIILYPFKGVGLEIDSFNNLAVDVMARTYSISEKTNYYNAFYTGVMNFYLDLGTVGVIVFSLLHGMFVFLALMQYKKYNNLLSLMLLAYVIKNLIFTILNWPYQGGPNTFVLIILIILNVVCNYKERRKIKNENSLDS